MSSMLIVLGYILAIIVGLTLGLLGGGGSILSVPILFYCFSLEPIEATTYSLFIVGAASVAGTFKYLDDKMISLPAFVLFGLPSVAAMFFTRRFLIHQLPDSLFSLGNFEITKDLFVIVLFAIIMIIASRFMIKGRDCDCEEELKWRDVNIPLTLILGIGTGFLTSIVGAGGGFIIIPVLIHFFKMPMKRAVGTSLCIIMINSLIGFAGDVSANVFIDWLFLMKFTGLTIVGIFLGIYLSHKISGGKLKPIFGWFVLMMGILIITKELIINNIY